MNKRGLMYKVEDVKHEILTQTSFVRGWSVRIFPELNEYSKKKGNVLYGDNFMIPHSSASVPLLFPDF
jgi:hypothetical protein